MSAIMTMDNESFRRFGMQKAVLWLPEARSVEIVAAEPPERMERNVAVFHYI
jgi:hypothetical protein